MSREREGVCGGREGRTAGVGELAGKIRGREGESKGTENRNLKEIKE